MSGLAFEVAGWNTETLAVNVSGFGSNIWLGSTTFASGNATPVAVLEDLAAWANDAARPWFGSATFSYTAMDTGVGPGSAFLGWTLDSGVAGTGFTPSAGLIALLGWTGVTAQTISSGASLSPAGGVFGPAAYRNPHRHIIKPGGRSPAGAFTAGHAPRAPVPVQIAMLLTEAGVYAFTSAVELAASPTRAHVFYEAHEQWRRLAGVEAILPPHRIGQLYRQTFSAWEDR